MNIREIGLIILGIGVVLIPMLVFIDARLLPEKRVVLMPPIRRWLRTRTGPQAPHIIALTCGVLFAVLFSIQLNVNTNQANCEQRAEATAAARRDFQQVYDALLEAKKSVVGEPPQILTEFITYFENRLASTVPFKCVDGRVDTLPVPEQES